LRIAVRRRTYAGLRATLDTFDVHRRLGAIRARLAQGEGALRTAWTAARHATDARLRTSVARLESLSPLAVLGRGYAVCWNADRTAIVRDSASVQPGQDVRVTLERGELDCRVKTVDRRQ
jgi:exodeoxyribonuclease VII large subunit